MHRRGLSGFVDEFSRLSPALVLTGVRDIEIRSTGTGQPCFLFHAAFLRHPFKVFCFLPILSCVEVL